MTKAYIIVAVVSYLLGSIPFGYILVKLFLKQDIRASGSGNIGATNVARSGAKGLAIATLLLDGLKGAVAVLIAEKIAGSVWYPYVEGTPIGPDFLALFTAIAAFMAVVGHMFPLWLGFRGGKGVATAVGAYVFMAPLPILCTLGFFTLIVGFTRYVSLGSISAALVFPLLAAWQYSDRVLRSGNGKGAFLLICSVSFLVILKHHENIGRLIAGTENKFGAKKSVPPPDAMEKQA